MTNIISNEEAFVDQNVPILTDSMKSLEVSDSADDRMTIVTDVFRAESVDLELSLAYKRRVLENDQGFNPEGYVQYSKSAPYLYSICQFDLKNRRKMKGAYPKLAICMPMCSGKTTLKKFGFFDVDDVPLSPTILELRRRAHAGDGWADHNLLFEQYVKDYCLKHRIETIMVHGRGMAEALYPAAYVVARPNLAAHERNMDTRNLSPEMRVIAKGNWTETTGCFEFSESIEVLKIDFVARRSIAWFYDEQRRSVWPDAFTVNPLGTDRWYLPRRDTFLWQSIDGVVAVNYGSFSVDTPPMFTNRSCRCVPVIKLVPLDVEKSPFYDLLFTYEEDGRVTYPSNNGVDTPIAKLWDESNMLRLGWMAKEVNPKIVLIGSAYFDGESVMIVGNTQFPMTSHPCRNRIEYSETECCCNVSVNQGSSDPDMVAFKRVADVTVLNSLSKRARSTVARYL